MNRLLDPRGAHALRMMTRGNFFSQLNVTPPDDEFLFTDWLKEPPVTTGWGLRNDTGFVSYCSLGIINDLKEADAKDYFEPRDVDLTTSRKKVFSHYRYFPILSIGNQPWTGEWKRRRFKCVVWGVSNTELEGTIQYFSTNKRSARLMQYVCYRGDANLVANVVTSSNISNRGGANYFHISVRQPFRTFLENRVHHSLEFYLYSIWWLFHMHMHETWIGFMGLRIENFYYRHNGKTTSVGLIDYSSAIVYNEKEALAIYPSLLPVRGNYVFPEAKATGLLFLKHIKPERSLKFVNDFYESKPERLGVMLTQIQELTDSLAEDLKNASIKTESDDVKRSPPNPEPEWFFYGLITKILIEQKKVWDANMVFHTTLHQKWVEFVKIKQET